SDVLDAADDLEREAGLELVDHELEKRGARSGLAATVVAVAGELLLDAGARRRRHVGPAVEHLGDGGQRHARLLRDGGEGHAASRGSCESHGSPVKFRSPRHYNLLEIPAKPRAAPGRFADVIDLIRRAGRTDRACVGLACRRLSATVAKLSVPMGIPGTGVTMTPSSPADAARPAPLAERAAAGASLPRAAAGASLPRAERAAATRPWAEDRKSVV